MIMRLSDLSKAEFPILLASILIVSFVAKCLIVLFFPQISPDSFIYEKFAENILRGCGFSLTDIDVEICTPSVGGYFPGYPFFISVVWTILGKSTHNLLLVQALLHSCAIFRLIYCVGKIGLNRAALLIATFVFSFSPLQMGWSRMVLTDALALTCAVWLAAEIVNCFVARKFKPVGLTLPFVCAVFIRPDSVFLLVFILFLWVYIENKVKNLLVFLLLSTLPISGWMIRNHTVSGYFIKLTADYAPVAPGYFRWVNTWVVNEHERSMAVFPFWADKNYSAIEIPSSANLSDSEILAARNVLSLAKVADGGLFPAELDQKFNEMAIYRENNLPAFYFASISIKRATTLLLNPFSSWGLPAEIKSTDHNLLFGFLGAPLDNISPELLVQIKGSAVKILIKAFSFIYRLMLFSIFIVYVFVWFFEFYNNTLESGYSASGDVRRLSEFILPSSFCFLFMKLGFFTYLVGLESRYLIQTIPFVELSVLLILHVRFLRNSKQNLSVS